MTVQLSVSPHYAQKIRLPERFERKFYIGPTELGIAYGLLHHVCIKDDAFYSEQINSLYFDTDDFDQHERSSSGEYRKDKVRIRWYGTEPDPSGMQTVFVELKSRHGFAGTKQRHRMNVPTVTLELKNLRSGIIPRNDLTDILAGFGFYIPEALIPVITISYWRYRFLDVATGQRVSLDCHIRSTMIKPESRNQERNLELPGAVIEIKGTSMALPDTLMQAKMLDTDWTRFSKYSASIDARGEAPGSIGRLSPSGRIVG